MCVAKYIGMILYPFGEFFLTQIITVSGTLYTHW